MAGTSVGKVDVEAVSGAPGTLGRTGRGPVAGGAGMVTLSVTGAGSGTVAGGAGIEAVRAHGRVGGVMDTVLEMADGGGGSGVARV